MKTTISNKVNILCAIVVVIISATSAIAYDAALDVNRAQFSPDGSSMLMTTERFHRLYVYDIKQEILTEVTSAKGAGYGANWDYSGQYIGFKWILDNGGQIPAVYNMKTRSIVRLSAPAAQTGIPVFAENGVIAFTIGRKLRVLDENRKLRHQYTLSTYANWIAISPDAAYVVFNDKNDQLWLLTLADGRSDLLTNDQYQYYAPRWSSNAKYVLVQTLQSKIVVLDIESKRQFNIGDGSDPVWTDDGEYLTYTREIRNKRYEIVSSDVIKSRYDGTNQRPCFAEPGDRSNGSLQLTTHQAIYYDRTSKQILKVNGYMDGRAVRPARPLNIVSRSAVQPEAPTYNVLNAETALSNVIDAPYIHQVYDTPNWFNGHWACGATSAMMGIAYYHILQPWPTTCRSPYSHTSKWGRYISDMYSFNGYTYNIRGKDPNGDWAYGGYGFIIQNNWADTKGNMAKYLRQHGIASSVDWEPTFNKLRGKIDQIAPFVVLTSITDAGHYQFVVGYDSTARSIIVNDPYGNDNQGYMNYNGKKVTYDWPGYNNGHVNLNNVWCFIYMRYPAPDFEVAEFTLADTVSVGDTLNVPSRFYNRGSGIVDNISVKYLLSTNSIFDAKDSVIAGYTIPSLNQNDSMIVDMPVVIPDSITSRRYGLGIRIDANDEIEELAEHNNLEYATFVVKGYAECSDPKPAPESSIANATPTISLRYVDRIIDIDSESVSMFVDGIDVTAEASVQSSRIEYTPESPMDTGRHHVVTHVGNKAGYITKQNWSFTVSSTTVVESDNGLPQHVELLQNYPNPFNSRTYIPFTLNRESDVTIKVFAIDGTLVQQYELPVQAAGVHQVVWNGMNNNGRQVASGIYFYRLQTYNYNEWRRLVYLK